MSVSLETQLTEMRDGIRVLRNEAVETRRILKMLVSVIGDTNNTNAALREELNHIRTARERADRVAEVAALAGVQIPASAAP